MQLSEIVPEARIGLCHASAVRHRHASGAYACRDSRGHRYGWGLALLTTPEVLFGVEACRPDRTPDESRERIIRQLRHILPALPEQRIARLAG